MMIRNSSFLLLAFILFLMESACVSRYVPPDLSKMENTEDLGLASERAYHQARDAQDKQEKLKYSQAGIHYSNKCLKKDPLKPICLYYNVLSRGIFIQNHIPNYQKSLKLMVKNCGALIGVDPVYQNGGCYRVLGNIYADAPAFSLNPENVTRDLDRSVDYLRNAVKTSPDYPLNHLFLARSLEKIGEKDEAKKQLEEFDRMATPSLDKEYPQWKKVRDTLAQKLH